MLFHLLLLVDDFSGGQVALFTCKIAAKGVGEIDPVKGEILRDFLPRLSSGTRKGLNRSRQTGMKGIQGMKTYPS
jgi:hypothetical protein